jgi:hypothetical protein
MGLPKIIGNVLILFAALKQVQLRVLVNPNLMVPEDYGDDTIITCSKCKHKARWVEFFPRKSTD